MISHLERTVQFVLGNFLKKLCKPYENKLTANLHNTKIKKLNKLQVLHLYNNINISKKRPTIKQLTTITKNTYFFVNVEIHKTMKFFMNFRFVNIF